MASTREELSTWFDRGIEQKATHMIIMKDGFDYSDYPVYVASNENSREVAEKKTGNMQSVMEVYDLSKSKEEQLNAMRVFNY